MANKFDGDVRPLSNDQRYMGVVFSGSIKNAIKQAKAAPDHGLAEQYVPKGISRNRAALLEHLGLLRTPPELAPSGGTLVIELWGAGGAGGCGKSAPVEVAVPEPGPYTLAFALKHFPKSFARARS